MVVLNRRGVQALTPYLLLGTVVWVAVLKSGVHATLAGVVTGLLPVTGVTLPFVSYGGTSLVVSMAITGILLNISRYIEKK